MSIKVELKLFAMLKELVGKARLEMEIPAKAGVEDLFQSLANQYPAVAELRDHLLIVRDREYLRAEDELTEGDVLSLYPPLSGG